MNAQLAIDTRLRPFDAIRAVPGVDEFQVVRFDGKSWVPTGETYKVPGSGKR